MKEVQIWYCAAMFLSLRRAWNLRNTIIALDNLCHMVFAALDAIRR